MHSTVTLPNIGIFGGAFDPIHQQHIAIMQAAHRQLFLDEVWVIPTGQSWHKAGSIAAPTHRLQMTKIACASYPWCSVLDVEIARSGASYTIDTLQSLQTTVTANWYLIIGFDQYLSFTQWHAWETIRQIAHLVVIQRLGWPSTTNTEIEAVTHGKPIHFLELPVTDTASSTIRSVLANDPLVCPAELDPAVHRYIIQHHLYA